MLKGQLIAGRYRLEEEVGAGGMGVVWRAVDEKLDRVVALKRAHVSGPARTLREARASAGLTNPHVITLYDVINDGGDQWLVLEYFPARSLAELIKEPMEPERVAGIGAQLADALMAVHANSTVHRDVKPSNVLVTEDGVAKLIDFGISRTTWSEPTLTDSSVAGTPAYLAPEVASGEDPSSAADVFALGATLFAAVEGVSPYGDSDNPLEILRKAARGQVLAAHRAGPLRPMLSAMLQRDPRRRPDAARVARQLGELASGNETTPMNRGRSIPRPRGRSVAVLGTAVAVIAAAAVVTLVVRGQHGTANEVNTGAAKPQSSAVPGLGDPHTADPCAFADPTVFATFGHAAQQTDSGNFNRCDVILNEYKPNETDVRFEFELPSSDDPASGPARKVGQLRVVAEPPESDSAARFIALPDDTRIEVTAELGNDTSTGADKLPAIADAAANHVVAVLSRGPVPRRSQPFPANSLANVDACSLLDPSVLAAIPGVDATNPESGFGNWDCQWNSTVNNTSVDVRFDMNQPPLTAEDGTPTTMSGRKAFVTPKGDGDDTCIVRVVNRQFTDRTNQATQELLYLEVNGDQPVAQMCTTANSLASSAAGKLPG